MGEKVQFDNYYSMRDLNHDSNATNWPLHKVENNLPNGQYHYNVLPKPTPDLFPGADKELLKQKMLEHEAVFRSQVFELHRLYRVQKDLMDEMQKKEQNNHRTPFETSSSSSPLQSQMTRDDAHRRNSSSFLFTKGVSGAPPVSDPEYVPSSTKGKSAQCGLIVSQNCASTRNSLVSDARPSKLRKMIDLQLPAEEYTDTDEVEQCGNGMNNDSGDKSFPSRCENTKSALADLNEPLEPEETNCFQNQDLLSKAPGVSEAVAWKPEHGNINGTQNNSHYNDKGNGQNWFLSVSKPEESKDNEKSYHHQPGIFPPKANGSFEMLDRTRSLSGFNNQEGHNMASHISSYVPYSNLVKSWDVSWRNSNNDLNHTSTLVQKSPFLDSAGLSKSSQSSAPSNGFLEAWWCRNDNPRSNPGSGTETPVKNGFYHGSSSGVYKELHASFSRAGPDYENSSYNDKATSGSNSFLKGTNSFDLNSTRDLNLNVPDCSSNELLAKGEDSVSVLPCLRAEATKNEAANRSEDRSTLDHQNSVSSTSCSAKTILGVPIFEAQLSEEREKKSEKKRILFDMNLPCDDPEEFENDEDKIETEHPNNGHRNMIDLNSCLIEDEIPSETSHTNSNMKKPERGIIIDLEAPVDLEDEEEEDVNCLPDEELPSSLEDSTDSSEKQLARVAAEAIIDISTSAPPQPPNETSASENENALHWLADVACFFPDNDDVDCISSDSDSFEGMTLKLTGCAVEEYFPNPPNFDALLAEEAGLAVNVTGRARRGPARRGRQRRDFQRDILPGLTSLARHEVTEDLQTFGGLMRATGHDWHCGTRRNSSGRGRRKAAVAPPPPPAVNATDFSPRKQIQKNGEIMLEDRSLTSWGKTTRRPRRQRCPPVGAGNPAPIPLTLIT